MNTFTTLGDNLDTISAKSSELGWENALSLTNIIKKIKNNCYSFHNYLLLPFESLKNSRNSLSGDKIIVVPSSPNTLPYACMDL